jgi:predicted DNA-binding protein
VADRLRQINVRLPENEAERIEQLATADGRTVSNYVRRVLELHIEEKAQ